MPAATRARSVGASATSVPAATAANQNAYACRTPRRRGMTSSSLGGTFMAAINRLVTHTCRNDARSIPCPRLMADRQTSRRTFLQLGGAGAASLFCTIGGERVDLTKAGAADRADAAAARVQRPPAARAFQQELPRPAPAPGGVHREYW